ncbi:SAM dependent carboxyl methyltransferase [Dillenia turbinata]|uniref:SAM dependent carboxyl methyltransferase n=1 Tax=Dillenia turbinata TaxID=194707 RepID=A0AAN8VF09_9MAGN
MGLENVLCMNGGEGENSYAQNSMFAYKVTSMTKPVLESTIRALFPNNFHPFNVLSVADLGCACGPNTISVISTVIEGVKRNIKKNNCAMPEIQFYLNDLVSNDFNSLFKDLSKISAQVEEDMSCFFMGVPGSFYGRLFPCNSLHLVHACYSLHWLSQVPPRLTSKKGLPLNKGKMYISKTSPLIVKEAYLSQFQHDFTMFLNCRAKEIVPEGFAVLVLHGREFVDLSRNFESCFVWELLALAIADLVSQGLIEKEKLDSFNIPYYIASKEEIVGIVKREGSFTVELIETFALDIGNEKDMNIQSKGQNAAKNIRCFTEPMISHHFENSIMEKVYANFTHLLIEYIAKQSAKQTSIVVVLRKKAVV